MNISLFLLLLATVYLAPHVRKDVGALLCAAISIAALAVAVLV